MNTANIKKYAPKARNNFIAAVTKQAARYGITAKGTEPMEQRGDIALIGEKAFSKGIAPARKALERMVEQMGFAQAMEQAAYSWFNRFCAIRYMEIHDFLDHGRRVLSTANGDPGTPQILDDCLDISLPGLDPQQVAELKLDGNKDEDLYRELLLAQCHALHEAMPFLFEAVDDATELLLPDNLTKTDSLIRELVSAIPEDDWQDVEIIGWLYQFYISEKKDQVIGKVVKSEDIPAATQLFTPNWIVQYLVQNSVGRQWLQTYPDSPLRNQMPYFIEPGEQPPEVQAQLDETVPDAIDPESIKVLDPACGSGHILVEAYKILKAIYEERGYRSRDIPQQILKHNLFGLDIDDRAGQLAGFALMMLAREDDRRLFSRVAEGDVTLNVLSLKETGHLDLPQLWQDLNLSGDWQQGSSQSLFESEQADLSSASADERYQLLQRTLERFEEAKTFGSLIEVPEEDAAPLKALVEEMEQLARTGDVMQKPAAELLLPFARQAWVLAQRYDSVIANPPYMGSSYFNCSLRDYASIRFGDWSRDLFSCFIRQSMTLSKKGGVFSLITIGTWAFLPTFEEMRKQILAQCTLCSIVDNGRGVWGSDHGSLMFSAQRAAPIPGVKSATKFLSRGKGKIQHVLAIESKFIESDPVYLEQDIFKQIPGNIISIGSSPDLLKKFLESDRLESIADVRQGIKTGDINRFLRYWHEVSFSNIEFNCRDSKCSKQSKAKWYPCNKGGEFRRWYGNQEFVLNWQNDGYEIRNFKGDSGKIRSRAQNTQYFYRPGITWSTVTMGRPSFRFSESGRVFESGGSTIFPDEDLYFVLGILNSSLGEVAVAILSPKVSLGEGAVAKFPIPKFTKGQKTEIARITKELVEYFAKVESWDESTFDFGSMYGFPSHTCCREFVNHCLETQNSIVKAVKLNEVTINGFVSDEYMNNEFNLDFKDLGMYEETSASVTTKLLSFFVGCVMGRFSLDKPSLILASQGETLQDYLNQIPEPRFLPDDDAILPLTDQEWFADDATNRLREFVRVVWGDEHLQENLDFVAESLCLHAIKPKRGESALDTIRRYLSIQFYKDHLRTYKKRPIYWLFSSGKHKAFECLVYLHRYNEGTLARMRTEYVIPLSAKLNAYAEKLEQDKDASTSAAETKRLEKEIATLHKQQTELAEFDEKLRHYADQRISLDLDDGVKVNYGKFGDLLAEVKAVTGEKAT